MSTFIQKADYAHLVKDPILDRLTQQTDAHLDSCELEAIEFVKSFLTNRYIVFDGAGGGIFEQTGTDRNPIILKYTLDVAVFYLYGRLAPNKVPTHRQDNYDTAVEWLTDVQEGKKNPPDLPEPAADDTSTDHVTFGSNTKRVNHV